MGFEDIVAQRYAVTEPKVKEGYNGIRSGRPRDLYEDEIEQIVPYIPRDFRVELLLKIGDIPDQLELELGSFRGTYNGEGILISNSQTYYKMVDGRELLSLIFNSMFFYFKTAEDAYRVHQLIYQLYKRLNEMNSALGVRMYISPYVLTRLHDYIVKMEQEDKFIINYINRVRAEGGDMSIFFSVRDRRVTTPKQHSSSSELSDVAKARMSQIHTQAPESNLGVVQQEPIYGQKYASGVIRGINPNTPNVQAQHRQQQEVKFVTNGELTFKKKNNDGSRIVVDFD